MDLCLAETLFGGAMHGHGLRMWSINEPYEPTYVLGRLMQSFMDVLTVSRAGKRQESLFTSSRLTNESSFAMPVCTFTASHMLPQSTSAFDQLLPSSTANALVSLNPQRISARTTIVS